MARFLKDVRARFPAEQRVYVIQDNLSAHWIPDIQEWASKHHMELVPTPVGALWLNPIECRFMELRSLAFDGSDYGSWTEAGRAPGGQRGTGRRIGSGAGESDNLYGNGTSRQEAAGID